MIIDLFNRGDGLRCLKEIYRLNDVQIKEIEDKCFEYETPPLSDDDIEELISDLKELRLPGESDDSIEQMREGFYNRSRLKRWPVDNCVEWFLKIADIQPDVFDLSEVEVSCRHITAVIDHGDSIKGQGMLRLDELLEQPSPLSIFLQENGIIIFPTDRRIMTDGKEYLISSDSNRFKVLSAKLYHDLGETEVFISGAEDELLRYSCIRDCPEILYTLDSIFKGKNLQKKWQKRKELLMIQFAVGFDECIIHRMPHDDCGLRQFMSQEYEDDVPEHVGRNYWVIRRCLENSSTAVELAEEYAAIKPDVRIGAERLVITEIGAN